MPSRTLGDEIGRLYQLPLDEFTSARNALAKRAGVDAAVVRALTKPSVPAWAVNQLYWRDRQAWDVLIAAAENARKVNRAVLAGKSGDVRAANQVHEESVDAALKATLAQLASSGHPITDATRQAVATTLRALPGEDSPGRLTKPLQPGGFETLAGLSVSARAGSRSSTSSTTSVTTSVSSAGSGPAAGSREPPASSRQLAAGDRKQKAGSRKLETGGPQLDAREITKQRQAEAAAARELKDAEAAVRRGEFEVARLEREEQRAQASLEKAREAVERAETDLRVADNEAAAAAAATRGAKERARKTREALTRAEKR